MEAEATDAFTQDWSHHKRFAPLVSYPLLPQSSLCSEGQADITNSTVAISTMIPRGTGHVRGHTSTITDSRRPYISPSCTGVSDALGMPKPGCMAYLRESFSSREVSPEASKLLLCSWRPNTIQLQLRIC